MQGALKRRIRLATTLPVLENTGVTGYTGEMNAKDGRLKLRGAPVSHSGARMKAWSAGARKAEQHVRCL